MALFKYECPRCRRQSEYEFDEQHRIKCGECLMQFVEIIDLVLISEPVKTH